MNQLKKNLTITVVHGSGSPIPRHWLPSLSVGQHVYCVKNPNFGCHVFLTLLNGTKDGLIPNHSDTPSRIAFQRLPPLKLCQNWLRHWRGTRSLSPCSCPPTLSAPSERGGGGGGEEEEVHLDSNDIVCFSGAVCGYKRNAWQFELPVTNLPRSWAPTKNDSLADSFSRPMA